MSYCRRGPDSDVYMYGTEYYDREHRRKEPFWICDQCSLAADGESVSCHTRSLALAHLLAHRAFGHKVPEYALDRVREEKDEPLA